MTFVTARTGSKEIHGTGKLNHRVEPEGFAHVNAINNLRDTKTEGRQVTSGS